VRRVAVAILLAVAAFCWLRSSAAGVRGGAGASRHRKVAVGGSSRRRRCAAASRSSIGHARDPRSRARSPSQRAVATHTGARGPRGAAARDAPRRDVPRSARPPADPAPPRGRLRRDRARLFGRGRRARRRFGEEVVRVRDPALHDAARREPELRARGRSALLPPHAYFAFGELPPR
jgi:hypothetical protein